ncbi:MAG: DUF87 domain-containing protein [SAR324 cluster bacterium]|nr:DUF87 domain-containing protein [SAR324 cluster bacterium]
MLDNIHKTDGKKTRPILGDLPLLAYQTSGPSRGKVGFRNLVEHERSIVTLSFAEACRNILVLGGTGSGKTCGVILPALDQLIDRHCAGLVLDIKGKFRFLAREYPGRVKILGAGDDALRLNLIGDLNTQEFMGLLKIMYGDIDTKQKRWFEEGVRQAGLIHAYLMASGQIATLDKVEQLLTAPDIFVDQLSSWLETSPHLPPELMRLLHRACRNPFSITAIGGFHGQTVHGMDASQQYEWYIGDVCGMLAPFRQNRVLTESFCAPQSTLSLSSLIYQQRKTLIFSGNSLQGEEGIARVLKSLFMKTIRESSGETRSQLGCGRTFFTFLVMDEYQHFVFAPRDNNRSIFPDDNRFFDTSREYGHINLIAVQSLESLLAQVPVASARTIISNCMNWLALTPLIDGTTQDHLLRLASVSGDDVLRSCVSPDFLGQGFFYRGGCFSPHGKNFMTIRTGALSGYP